MMEDTSKGGAAVDTNANTSARDPKQPMQLHIDYASEAKYSPGRRTFFKYRNLGVEAASNGRARGYQNTSIAGMLDSTGWHYHECDFQFVYLLKGELILEFEDGTVHHLSQGDSMFIPGGLRHNEIYVSEDKDSIEFSMPEKIGTVPVERPAHLPAVLKPMGNVEKVRAKMAAEQSAFAQAAAKAAKAA